MSEKSFQRALVHFCTNIDKYPPEAELQLDRFALSTSEEGWLVELLASQREAVLLFHRQMRGKHRRLILDGLPNSYMAARERLETLVDTFLGHPWTEGACDPATAVRPFAGYVEKLVAFGKEASREAEFIWFEATCAAVSLPQHGGVMRGARQLTMNTRLSTNGDTALIGVSYDVLSVIDDHAVLERLERFSEPDWLFLFQAQNGTVRVLRLSRP